MARHLRLPVPLRFLGWDEAIRYLFTTGDAGLVVLDEFPYLSKVSPSLPSILQREVDRAISEGTAISLILWGSAMSGHGRAAGGQRAVTRTGQP